MDGRDIGGRLAALREARGLSMEEVAQRMGRTSSGAIATLEETAYLSRFETLDRYLVAVGATWEDVLRPGLPAGSAAFDYDRVGAALAAGRIDSGMRQADLASAMGVGANAISQLERGETLPRWQTLTAFWQALPAYDLLWLAWCLFRGTPIEFVARASEVAARFDRSRIAAASPPPDSAAK